MAKIVGIPGVHTVGPGLCKDDPTLLVMSVAKHLCVTQFLVLHVLVCSCLCVLVCVVSHVCLGI